MTLLPGKLVVKCPKTDNEVNVRKDCVECKAFKHVSWEGLKPLITCDYEKKPEQSTVPHGTSKKTSIDALKRW